MYAPFPIASFESGIITEREPWLLPQDAVSRMENAHLWRGQIKKRPTSKLFTQIGTKVIDEPLGTTVLPGGALLAGNTTWTVFGLVAAPLATHALIVNLPIVPSTLSVADGGTDSVTDKPFTMSLPPYTFRATNLPYPSPGGADPDSVYLEGYGGGLPASPYQAAVNLRTGEWFVALQAPDAFTASACTATYEFHRGLPSMLITEWVNAAGTRELVVCDTKRLFVWNVNRLRLDDKTAVGAVIATDDIWSGVDTGFYSSAVVDDGSQRKLVIVNGTDPPQKWDGTTISAMGVSGEFTSAAFVFAQYGHVIYLAPTIGGAQNRQKAFWSDQFLTETVTAANYAVAYTGERLVTAAMVNDELIVFFDRSVWKLRYTGDWRVGAQFEWVHVGGGVFDRQDSAGALAAMGIVSTGDKAIVVSSHGIVEANGVQVVEAAHHRVPDIMERFLDPTKMSISYGAAFDPEHKLLFTACSTGSATTEPDRTLAVDMHTGAISLYSWSYRLFGLYRRQEQVPVWDAVPWKDELFDDVTVIVDGVSGQTGYPTLLAADRDGFIYEIPGIGNDVLGDSTVRVDFKALNPFVGNGQRADFGHLLVYAQPLLGETLRLSFYRDHATAPWKIVDIPLDPPAGKSRVEKLIRVNSIGNYHRIRIEHTGAADLMIDGLIPYFQPAGEMEGLV